MAAPIRPALQIQRTQLSWERTAVSLLAVAGTLLVHRTERLTWDRGLLAAAATLVALAVLWIGQRRGRHRPRTTPAGREVIRSYGREIVLIGWSTAVLALAVAVMVALD